MLEKCAARLWMDRPVPVAAPRQQDPPRAEGQLDRESAVWVDALEGGREPQYELACTRLHERLVRIAMDEVFRRGPRYRIAGPELNDLAHQAAAHALMRITHKIQTPSATGRRESLSKPRATWSRQH